MYRWFTVLISRIRKANTQSYCKWATRTKYHEEIEFAIRDSRSEKSSGEYRTYVDFRKLNAVTVKDKYPLLWIDNQLDKLGGNCYFTRFGSRVGILPYQIPMAADFRKLLLWPQRAITNFYECVRAKCAGDLPKTNGSGIGRLEGLGGFPISRWRYHTIQNDRRGYASAAPGLGCVSSA